MLIVIFVMVVNLVYLLTVLVFLDIFFSLIMTSNKHKDFIFEDNTESLDYDKSISDNKNLKPILLDFFSFHPCSSAKRDRKTYPIPSKNLRLYTALFVVQNY